MKKGLHELKDENKRSFTKLTEEVIAGKLENRKNYSKHTSFDDYKDLKKLPFVVMEDFDKFEKEVENDEEKLRQFKQFIEKTGGEGPAQFIRAAIRKIFTDELASYYSWKETTAKPSAEKCFLITVIKNICHIKFKCTDKDMNSVLQKHFVHAKDRMTKKRKRID